jgi:cytochrome c oxidase assembly protein subunit 15
MNSSLPHVNNGASQSDSGLFLSDRGVRIWLVSICLTLILMISIGGITRLTGSGLSITDWKPIMGAIPPLHEKDWLIAFDRYKEIPQYKLVNAGISLSEFKFLFFWEWFHRLIGRLIGVIVFVPGLYFYLRGRLSKPLASRVAFGFLLGGLQGLLGWFMVMSGLSERTSVSHYRLAAHLGLALVILAYFVWITRSVFIDGKKKSDAERESIAFMRPWLKPLVALFTLQIVYGAFVAGMKAGKIFNTFPLMEGSLVPGNLLSFTPAWLNFFENPAMIQWIHRSIAWVLLALTATLWIRLRMLGLPRNPVRIFTTGLAHLTILQFIVGVATLLMAVPISLGVFHQFCAALIVSMLTLLAHSLRKIDLEQQS